MNATTPARAALVLSGGSAYGAFSVGVMKVLFAGRSAATDYRPLEAGIFSGTSIGAFNAALIVSHPEESSLAAVLHLEKVWLERIAQGDGKSGNGIFRVRGNPFDYFDFDGLIRHPTAVAERFATDSIAIANYVVGRTANFLASHDPLETRLVNSLNASSFVDESPFRTLLYEVIDEESIRQSAKLLSISTTNWVLGEVVRFSNSDFHHNRGVLSILASAAVPGLFPPVSIGTDRFVDGGAVENTPLSPAINLGATELHVIDLDPRPQFLPLSAQPNTLETLLRVYYIMQATKMREDIETVRWINAGLRALKSYRGGEEDISSSSERDFIRAGGVIQERSGMPYRTLKLHRYYPRVFSGSSLALLDFGTDEIERLIELGENQALSHDCEENDCVI
jgi:predicted acylesterase/phospholipase RssA